MGNGKWEMGTFCFFSEKPECPLFPLRHIVDFFAFGRDKIRGRDVQCQRRGTRDIDRRIGTDHNTDDERQRKAGYRLPTEQE